MGHVRFAKADPRLPADKGGRRWLHRRAQRQYRKDGSWSLADAVYFHPGNTYEVTDYEENYLVKLLPQCFEVASSSGTAGGNGSKKKAMPGPESTNPIKSEGES